MPAGERVEALDHQLLALGGELRERAIGGCVYVVDVDVGMYMWRAVECWGVWMYINMYIYTYMCVYVVSCVREWLGCVCFVVGRGE